MKEGLLPARTKRCRCGCDETEIQIHPEMIRLDEEETGNGDDDDNNVADEEDDAMVKLEKEMWETFYSTGFWRSPSQRETPTNTTVVKEPSNMSKVKPL